MFLHISSELFNLFVSSLYLKESGEQVESVDSVGARVVCHDAVDVTSPDVLDVIVAGHDDVRETSGGR